MQTRKHKKFMLSKKETRSAYANKETLEVQMQISNFRSSYTNKETLEVHMQIRTL